jgi:hypothetical protein
MSNKSSSKKQHCCPCCRSTSFSSVRGLTTHMTQYCSSRPISSQNTARNNLLGKDSAYAGNKVTALSNLYPISKRCVQDNVPQFGSISCSVSNDIVPSPFLNIDPRNPTSEKHPHLYNYVSLVNGHQASMDKIRAEEESNSTCSPCADVSFDGRDQEFHLLPLLRHVLLRLLWTTVINSLLEFFQSPTITQTYLQQLLHKFILQIFFKSTSVI